MKTIQDVYTEYKLMPSLQLHQLRVAAVAKLICTNLNTNIDTENVIKACLVHDMGNILKFDLPRFPDFLEPEGLGYWEGVKVEFAQKYGPEEHVATEMIAKEIGLDQTTLSYLSLIGFSKLDIVNSNQALENKICSYADMRVGPHGVLSMDERLADLQKRYEKRKHTVGSDRFESLQLALKNIEKDIFSTAKIKSKDINDDSIAPLIKDLRSAKIQ